MFSAHLLPPSHSNMAASCRAIPLAGRRPHVMSRPPRGSTASFLHLSSFLHFLHEFTLLCHSEMTSKFILQHLPSATQHRAQVTMELI